MKTGLGNMALGRSEPRLLFVLATFVAELGFEDRCLPMDVVDLSKGSGDITSNELQRRDYSAIDAAEHRPRYGQRDRPLQATAGTRCTFLSSDEPGFPQQSSRAAAGRSC
jgi:hypothetical protein